MELSTISYLVAALALALTFGGMTFFSAVVTPLVFSKLPLKTAGPFTRQVFPRYYLTMGVAVLIAISALLLETVEPAQRLHTFTSLLGDGFQAPGSVTRH